MDESEAFLESPRHSTPLIASRTHSRAGKGPRPLMVSVDDGQRNRTVSRVPPRKIVRAPLRLEDMTRFVPSSAASGDRTTRMLVRHIAALAVPS